jgi:hypothetical protein
MHGKKTPKKPLILVIIASAGPAVLVLLIPPIREAIRHTAMYNKHWLVVILMSLIPIAVVDIFKLLRINTTPDEKKS